MTEEHERLLACYNVLMKIPKTLGLSEELWEVVGDLQGPVNRSAFVEAVLWVALSRTIAARMQYDNYEEKVRASDDVLYRALEGSARAHS